MTGFGLNQAWKNSTKNVQELKILGILQGICGCREHQGWTRKPMGRGCDPTQKWGGGGEFREQTLAGGCWAAATLPTVDTGFLGTPPAPCCQQKPTESLH